MKKKPYEELIADIRTLDAPATNRPIGDSAGALWNVLVWDSDF